MNAEKLVEEIRQELRSGFGMVASEIKGVNSRLDETNSRLDETNSRLDKTNSRLDETNSRLDETNSRLEETNSRLDETNSRLDGAIKAIQSNGERIDRLCDEVKGLRAEMIEKFDGVGRYLESIDGHLATHDSRFNVLEYRVSKIEKRLADK